MRRAAALVATVASAVAGALAAGGCTSLVRQTARAATTSSWALAAGEQRLRDALVGGRWDDALRTAASEKQGGPGDRLLRDLYAGTVAYYAGRWDSTTAALDRAATLADDRYTKSVTRGAVALATNDLALPYVPGQNERLLVHYYAMLAWLRRDARADARADVRADAVVEARRIGQMLEEYDGDRNALDRSTRAMLRVVSGAVFEAAGETNDAAVAYRNARALLGGALPWDADPAPAGPRGTRRAIPDSGGVLVVVEQGFVAHRVEQRLVVRAVDDAAARATSLLTGDAGLWADSPRAELALEAAEPSSARLPNGPPGALPLEEMPRAAVGPSTTGPPNDRAPNGRTPRAPRAPGRFQLAWPAYRRPAAIPLLTLGVDGVAVPSEPPTLRANVSDAVAGDFRRDRGARLARLLLRAAARSAAVSELGRKHKELGSLVGTVTNVVEQADTRSWHLLPGVITVARLRLPVGEHAIVARLDGTVIPVGTVHVAREALALATTRVWSTGVRPAPANE